MVALTIKAVLNPQTWHWPSRPPHQAPHDTRLRQVAAREPLDGEFWAPAPDAAPQPRTTPRFPGVRQEFLAEIRDDKFFRPRESNAFFHLFELLQNAGQAELEQASIGPVTFSQLQDQPAAFRGAIVTLRGRLRQLQRVAAVQNEYDIESYYHATIQPDDNPTFPVLVYLLELPPGFSSKLELPGPGQTVTVEAYNEEVDITGFYFKRLAYQAKDDVRTAPLVLARSFHWRTVNSRGTVERAATRDFTYLAAGTTAGAVIFALLLVWSRGTLAGWARSSRSPAAGAFQQLADIETQPTPSEYLRQIETSGSPTRAPANGPPATEAKP